MGERAIKRGDEVIGVAAGFPTTVNPIIQFGAVPVFVDVDRLTHNIDAVMAQEAQSDGIATIIQDVQERTKPSERQAEYYYLSDSKGKKLAVLTVWSVPGYPEQSLRCRRTVLHAP